MGYTVHYYDLVLFAIVGSLGMGGAVGALTAVAMPIAILAFGGVAIGFVGHALFVNGPVDDVEDLTAEVEDAPVPTEKLPLFE